MRQLVSSAFYEAGLWNLKDSNSGILGSSDSISLNEAKEMFVKFEDEIRKQDENLAVTDVSYFTDWFGIIHVGFKVHYTNIKLLRSLLDSLMETLKQAKVQVKVLKCYII